MEKIDSYKTLLTFVNGFANKETAEESPFVFAIKGPDSIGVQTCVDSKAFVDLYRGITDAFVEGMKKSGASRIVITNLLAMICAEMTAKHYPMKDKVLDNISDETIEKLKQIKDILGEALASEDEE